MSEKLQKQLMGDEEIRQFLGKIDALPKGKRIALVVHKNPPPDPDALASATALQHYLSLRDIKSDIFGCGAISHPQNIAMINRFKIELRDDKFWEKNQSNYGLVIFCDTDLDNASIVAKPEITTIIIDHHTAKSFDDKHLAIIKKVGAASTIIYCLLKKAGFEFSHPSLIATALAIGIDVDTKSFTKTDEITEFDIEAHKKLMPLIDYSLFRHLTERYELRKGFFKCLKKALGPDFDEIFIEDLAILGVGNIKRSQIDYIPMIADWILRAEETRLVVVIGVVDDQFVKASVRTDLESIQIDQFCQKVFGGDDPTVVASTGARPGSGGAIVPLNASECEKWARANPKEKQLLFELKLISYRRTIMEEILPDIQR